MVHFRQIFGPQKVSRPKSTPNAQIDQFFVFVTKFCMFRVHLSHLQLLGVSWLDGPDCQSQLGVDFSRTSDFLAHFRHSTTFEARLAFKHISLAILDRQFEWHLSLGQWTNDLLTFLLLKLKTEIISEKLHSFE